MVISSFSLRTPRIQIKPLFKGYNPDCVMWKKSPHSYPTRGNSDREFSRLLVSLRAPQHNTELSKNRLVSDRFEHREVWYKPAGGSCTPMDTQVRTPLGHFHKILAYTLHIVERSRACRDESFMFSSSCPYPRQGSTSEHRPARPTSYVCVVVLSALGAHLLGLGALGRRCRFGPFLR